MAMEGDNCIFCKIIKGQIPSYKVYEDDYYVAFLDLVHFTKGHTLLIPKKHSPFIWETEDIGELYRAAKKIADHYRNALGYKYVDTATFGRDVPHTHIHLVPHNGEDTDWKSSLRAIGEIQKDRSRWLSKEEGEKVAKEFQVK